MKKKTTKKSERITIVLDSANHKKLRLIQSKKILSGTSYSFSRVINEVLRKAL